MIRDITVLILSCDKYSSLWNAHLDLLFKNWKDLNSNVLLVTDKKTNFKKNNVEVVSNEENDNFSFRLLKSLSLVNTEYVLITLDDYFLKSEVSSSKFEKIIEVMKEKKLDYIRLFKYPNSVNGIYYSEDILGIELFSNYSVNLYPGVWNRESLLKIITKDYNPWEFEVTLTKLSFQNEYNCALTYENVYPILDVVRKGKLLHKAKKYLELNNIDIGSWEVVSYFEEIKLSIMFYLNLFLPKKIKKILKSIFKYFGVKFYSE